jgi:hypothetical protein
VVAHCCCSSSIYLLEKVVDYLLLASVDRCH